MNPDEIRRRFPNASASTIARNLASGPDSKPQPHPVSALVKKSEVLRINPCSVAVRISLCRYGRRLLDDDNFIAACKPLRDAIADSLKVDDADPRLEWEYLQVKTGGEVGVLVKIDTVTKKNRMLPFIGQNPGF